MNVAKLASRILLAAPIVVALNGTAPAYEPAYRIVKQIAIGAPEKWDFLYFDSSSDRIFIAHGTEVTVVDGAKGTIIGRLSGLNIRDLFQPACFGTDNPGHGLLLRRYLLILTIAGPRKGTCLVCNLRPRVISSEDWVVEGKNNISGFFGID